MRKQMGVSFIEILISMIILSLILLEFDALNIMTLRENKTVYYVSVAMQQLDVISERLASIKNSKAVLDEWNKQNASVLPQGIGTLESMDSHYLLSIYWGGLTKRCDKNVIGLSGCLSLKLGGKKTAGLR